MPQHIFYEVRGVFLLKHFIPLFKNLEYIIVQVLIECDLIVMTIQFVVEAYMSGETGWCNTVLIV